MPIELSEDDLPEIAATASVPHYKRGSLSAGIVHFGVGNFHRAHQAVYLDSLFNLGLDHDWGLVGAGVRDTDALMRDVDSEQVAEAVALLRQIRRQIETHIKDRDR